MPLRGKNSYFCPMSITYRLVLCLLLLLPLVNVTGQTKTTEKYKTASRQIEFRSDNDFWLSTDWYYTTGSFIEYRFLKDYDSVNQRVKGVEIGLRQEIYTPSDLRSTNTREYDRPFAGFLGLSAKLTTVVGSDFFWAEGLLGIAGPASLAEDFQRFWHGSAKLFTPPWTDQIANSFHANVYSRFGREWILRKGNLGLTMAFDTGIALGTKDINAEPGLRLFFGKRQPTHQSIAYGQLGKLYDELFFSARIGYRYVVHDAMIEGNFAGDDSVLLFDASTHLLKLELGIYWRWGKNDIKAILRHTSRQTAQSMSHAHLSFSYARSWN